jgi:hypothetical protein
MSTPTDHGRPSLTQAGLAAYVHGGEAPTVTAGPHDCCMTGRGTLAGLAFLYEGAGR